MKLGNLILTALVAFGIYAWLFQPEFVTRYLPAPSGEETDVAAEDEIPQTIGGSGNPVSVVAIRSVAQDVQSGIVLRGRTEAARRLDVAAETSGQVISNALSRGTLVEAGDVMCELDPQTREASLAQAIAAREEARVNAEAAEQLAERGLGPENTAIARRAQLQAAEAAVDVAQREIERLTITAPFTGLLEADTAELGSLMQPGAICGTLLDLSTIRLVGFAAERDVSKIEVGAFGGARLISGEELAGTVSFVGRSADPLTRTFRVEIDVPNEDLSIRDGSTAEIAISLAGVEAHLLPQVALTLDDEGRLGVRTVQNDQAMFKPVEVIRDNAEGVWVSGLDAQEDVIVTGQEFVSDGRTIAVTYQDQLGQQGDAGLTRSQLPRSQLDEESDTL
ncbi:efflux RND transporter periplasmic adaptor subunit [Pontivivens insulae]|uniref:Multidrug resistance protein MdtA n=1 Tax=Pontivivens insulae TaxID=1639689 RepID=A0A2R8ABQ7_9RHOB|nr:efflux RND transporter periplasmic adaptor subunit [Pontivivens insulae]RED11312.1 multidrug efflux system membrane fusion protein [Pontivivens insulae]SPF29515.1 Multidrug resistance protein MdtA [Pontivivens insulae]